MSKTPEDEYTTMQEAAVYCKMPVRTVYRLARDIGVATVRYGRHLVPTRKLDTLKASRRTRGNPNWIASAKSAADDAILAAKSRLRNRKARA